MEGIWKRAFGKGLLEEGKFLEGNWHAPVWERMAFCLYLGQKKIAPFGKRDQTQTIV